jgi:hypothetical protein
MIHAIASTRISRTGTARRARLCQSHVAQPFLAVLGTSAFVFTARVLSRETRITSHELPVTNHQSPVTSHSPLTPRHRQHRIAPRFRSNAERNFKEERIQ